MTSKPKIAAREKLKGIISSIYYNYQLLFFLFSDLICNLGIIAINSRLTCFNSRGSLPMKSSFFVFLSLLFHGVPGNYM